MNVLALDTAADILSVALRSTDGRRYAMLQDAGLRHSERLLTSIDLLVKQASLAPSDLNLIAVSLGPGSFTGLRIGLATAKGLAAAIGAYVVQVDNLAVYGRICASFEDVVLPVIDAKKKRFYASAYRGGSQIFEAGDLSVEQIIELTSGVGRTVVTGPHARLFMERLGSSAARDRFHLDPSHRRGIAVGMLDMAIEVFTAHGPASDDCTPRYLRLSDAELSIQKSPPVAEQ